MKRSVATAAVVLALALGPAHAGGLVLPIMEEEVTQAAAQGSRAGIIVPVLALILVGLAVSRNSGSDGGPKILPPPIEEALDPKVLPVIVK